MSKNLQEQSTKKDHSVVSEKEAYAAGKIQLSDRLGDAHFNPLPTKNLIICLCSLALGSIISFADQTGVTVALPYIAKDLGAENTINWAGTASLLANTVCQVLFGRVSDIFGRKSVMLACLLILVIADLCCGFAQTGLQFYIFRAFAGIGNGGVSSLTMVILSDITTLEQRGKYQGILGSSVGVGNAVGPFIMAAFHSKYSWRGFYYMLAPLGCIVIVTIYFLVEDRGEQLNQVLTKKDKMKKIDYLGLLTATVALTLLLVPISGGGTSYPWNSPKVIIMIIVGGLCFISFLLIEWKIPQLPMIPLEIFKVPSLSLILGSSFLFGMTYFSFLYYMPYFFQIVRDKDLVQASIFILPLVLSQAAMSIASGQLITRTQHYLPSVIFGYFTWLFGIALLRLWDKEINDGICALILLIMGTGVGFTFQPTMVAAQAQAKKSQRAVVISTRNVMRSFGGAVGIAVGSTIISNSLLKKINQKGIDLPPEYVNYMKGHIFNKIKTNQLTSQEADVVKNMYVLALRNYFYVLIPLIAICLISSLFIRDRGLKCIDEPQNINNEPELNLSISTSSSATR
ncbi:uncharacterized protein PRCAT00004393001 [Priceomyces carsonii]|uniref:uncharacterized protein n=1 Tax=Priceomyces carsonii TaxID=28549 RepID=UPI002ED98F29|nr:unnamed protein product [Priceomyces carsonii]